MNMQKMSFILAGITLYFAGVRSLIVFRQIFNCKGSINDEVIRVFVYVVVLRYDFLKCIANA